MQEFDVSQRTPTFHEQNACISDGKFWDFCRSEVLQSSSLKIPVLADGGFLSEMLIKIPVFCMNNQNSVQSEGSVEPKVMPSWSPGT